MLAYRKISDDAQLALTEMVAGCFRHAKAAPATNLTLARGMTGQFHPVAKSRAGLAGYEDVNAWGKRLGRDPAKLAGICWRQGPSNRQAASTSSKWDRFVMFRSSLDTDD